MYRSFIISIIACCLFLSFFLHAQDNKTVFKAGFAEKDITPDIGMEQPGGYHKAYHRSFHDRCKVRAVVLDDGEKRIAIVGLDLLFISRNIVKEVRSKIKECCGISTNHIMVGASHNHSAGPIS